MYKSDLVGTRINLVPRLSAETKDSTEDFKTISINCRLGEVSDVEPLMRSGHPNSTWATAQMIFINRGHVR